MKNWERLLEGLEKEYDELEKEIYEKGVRLKRVGRQIVLVQGIVDKKN
jgi:hypothetical protein